MPRLARNASRLATLLLTLPAALPAQRVRLQPRAPRTPLPTPTLAGPAAVQVIAVFPTTAMIAFQPVSRATGYTLLRAPRRRGRMLRSPSA